MGTKKPTDAVAGRPISPATMDNLDELLKIRAKLLIDRAAIDGQVDMLNKHLMATMEKKGEPRFQTDAGAILQVIQPKAAEKIVAEKLLAEGVSPLKIQRATVVTPRAPYIRVDMPKDGETAETLPAGADLEDAARH